MEVWGRYKARSKGVLFCVQSVQEKRPLVPPESNATLTTVTVTAVNTCTVLHDTSQIYTNPLRTRQGERVENK